MILRFLAGAVLVWALGFLAFALTLPGPADGERTDGVIVPTGRAGRIERGLEVLERGWADRLLVTGVDPEVKPGEFAAQFEVDERLMNCCITLGFAAVDTRSNAVEAARWVRDHKIRSLRLVTTDWHMRRAALELQRALDPQVTIVRDAVPSQPDTSTLFLEYHKLLAVWLSGLARWR